jgi:hypothetical protein
VGESLDNRLERTLNVKFAILLTLVRFEYLIFANQFFGFLGYILSQIQWFFIVVVANPYCVLKSGIAARIKMMMCANYIFSSCYSNRVVIHTKVKIVYLDFISTTVG